MVSYFDDLDFFKDFENEFPAIVYNDALTSKSDQLTEPTLCPQHIDEFDLKDETSLSECDEVEQNILYFNNVFPFNIIYPDNPQSDKDNDDNKIDIIQCSGDMAPLPPLEQRQPLLRYLGLEYSDRDIADFEERMLMEHRNDDGVVVFTTVLLDLDTPNTIQFQLKGDKRHMCWREFILALGLHTGEEMESLDFARRLAYHFGLVSDDGLRGLSIVTRELMLIDMGKLFKLKICMEVGDNWGWVAQGVERQPVAAAAAPRGAKDAPDIDEGAQAVLAPIQAPPPPPPAASRTMPRGPRCKEIDDVGEVSTIWKSRSVGVLKSQDGCSTQSCS
ncbi:hypothetical protein Tco_1369424 [Tanacetum coccineum]